MPLFTHLRPRSMRRIDPAGFDHPERNDIEPARRFETVNPKVGSEASPAPLFDPVLRSRLRQRLLALPYRPFLQAVVHLLSAQGYQAVTPAGRTRFKGRGTGGGWDLEARYAADETGPRLCVARIKQFATQPVDLRYVDELRGAALRAGADEALLVTLAGFSKPARLAALSRPLPVRLVDGEALLDDLLGQEVGVRRTAVSRKIGEDRRTGEWEVDDTYFGLLERRFAEEKGGKSRSVGEQVPAGQHPGGGGRLRETNRAEASASCAPPVRPVSTAVAQAGVPLQAVRVTITIARSQNGRSCLQ